MSVTPRVDRPGIPRDYGISKATEHVDWARVEERLAGDRVYWIATVGIRPRKVIAWTDISKDPTRFSF